MPNLENLRKQAKLYLRWHRDGHYPVAAQIRAVLPRFRDLSDREVLQQSFKLADAQELVARQAGFESWQALKAGVQTMSDKQATVAATPTLNSAEPELFVADFQAACAFFTEKLGFEIVFTYGEPPFYGQVRRGQALLNLRLICRARLRGRHPRARGAPVGRDHGQQRGRDPRAIRRVPGGRCRFLPLAEAGAVGRPHLHRARS